VERSESACFHHRAALVASLGSPDFHHPPSRKTPAYPQMGMLPSASGERRSEVAGLCCCGSSVFLCFALGAEAVVNARILTPVVTSVAIVVGMAMVTVR
jgi:hypothetical protein